MGTPAPGRWGFIEEMEVEGVGGIACMPTVPLDLGMLLQDARILCGSDHCLMRESGCWCGKIFFLVGTG